MFRLDKRNGEIRPPQEWIRQQVPPIVDAELFKSVAEAMHARGPRMPTSKASQSTSLLTGIAQCTLCGKGLNVMTGKSGRYAYYRCGTKSSSGATLCKCPNAPKEELERAVLMLLQRWSLSQVELRSCLASSDAP